MWEMSSRLNGNLIRRDSSRPLHSQIRDILQQYIIAQELTPGTPIPTEEELQKRFGVSRSVIRQALSGLVDLGLIQRQRGRGSVIAPAPVLHRHIQQAGGLGEQVAAKGQTLKTHIISLKRCSPPVDASKALATTDAWEIERLRSVDGSPVAFMRTWVPYKPFSHFSESILDNYSLLDRMREYGYQPSGGPRSIQAVSADKELAQYLDAQILEPLLLLKGVTQDASGMGLEWFNVWHSPNTVFDVNAQVSNGNIKIEQQITRLQKLSAYIETELDIIKNAPKSKY